MNKKKDCDDLTIKVFKELGSKRQEAIREKLEVCTYAEFAQKSASEISEAIKGLGPVVELETIEQWRAVALELAESSEQRLTESDNESQKSPELPTAEGEWEWLPEGFILEFCVKKNKSIPQEKEMRMLLVKLSKQGDWLENGQEVLGRLKNSHQLVTWLEEQEIYKEWQGIQVDNMIEPESPTESAIVLEEIGADKEAAADFSLEVKTIRILESQTGSPVLEGGSDQGFMGSLYEDELYTIEVDFTVPEMADVTDAEKRPQFKGKFYTKPAIGDGFLGETDVEPLAIGQENFIVQLPNVKLQAGTYALGAIVHLRSSKPVANYLEVPQLHVI